MNKQFSKKVTDISLNHIYFTIIKAFYEYMYIYAKEDKQWMYIYLCMHIRMYMQIRTYIHIRIYIRIRFDNMTDEAS